MSTLTFDSSTWMTEEDRSLLESLVASLLDSAVVVEVGTWTGGSALWMAAGMREPQHLFTVDCYPRDFGDYIHGVTPNVARMRFYAHLLKNGLHKRVTPLCARSEEVAPMFAKESVDLLFLDGDHSYEGVREDATAWWPRLKQDALLVLDDAEWPGVSRLIKELEEGGLVKFVRTGGAKGLKIYVGRKAR